jgi:CDP-glycerol glycerophosphotransferase (TagB/SpsB family)
LILFSARGGVAFEGNAKYLFLYANRQTDFRCVWIAKSRAVVEAVKREGGEAVFYFSWRALNYSLKANAVFITHSLFDAMPVSFKSKTTIIDLWHGVSIKRISFLDKNLGLKSRFMDTLKSKRINYMISNSEDFAPIYARSFKIGTDKIRSFGFPTIEYLRKPSLFSSGNNSYFPEGKRIILYAPTFRDYEFINPIFKPQFLKWLNDELEISNSLFYIKLHPTEKTPSLESFENIRIVDSSFDIYKLCLYTDYLISDYSSVFLDFISAFPERIVALYIPDFETYKSVRDFNFNYYEKFNSLICADERDLLKMKAQDNMALVEFINPDMESCKMILELI